jgi:hypothetical protein
MCRFYYTKNTSNWVWIFIQKLHRKALYNFLKTCSSTSKDSKTIGFTFFRFFYNVLRIFEVAAKTLEYLYTETLDLKLRIAHTPLVYELNPGKIKSFAIRPLGGTAPRRRRDWRPEVAGLGRRSELGRCITLLDGWRVAARLETTTPVASGVAAQVLPPPLPVAGTGSVWRPSGGAATWREEQGRALDGRTQGGTTARQCGSRRSEWWWRPADGDAQGKRERCWLCLASNRRRRAWGIRGWCGVPGRVARPSGGLHARHAACGVAHASAWPTGPAAR